MGGKEHTVQQLQLLSQAWPDCPQVEHEQSPMLTNWLCGLDYLVVYCLLLGCPVDGLMIFEQDFNEEESVNGRRSGGTYTPTK